MSTFAAARTDAAVRGASRVSGPLQKVARHAWLLILLADAGIAVYGVSALVSPSLLAPGYESATGSSWAALATGSPDTAAYLSWVYRLVGGVNVGLGIALVAIAAGPFRHGERWAWWTLLIANAFGYGVPMAFDQFTGAIGSFEILEFVAVGAVAVALVLTAAAPRPKQASLPATSGGH